MSLHDLPKSAKRVFLSKLQSLAETLYSRGDSTSHDDSWANSRSYLWGFAEAGKTLHLVESEEIQSVIDDAHLRVFGEGRLERIERLKPISENNSEIDWDAFDSPTYERKQSS